MKVVWLTDSHLEWLNDRRRSVFFKRVASEEAEAVLVGGDYSAIDFLEASLLKLYKTAHVPIFFVLGNHDYYRSSISEVRELAQKISAEHKQITWLTAAGLVPLNDNIGLVGHGCWGDGVAGSFFESPLRLNDFKFIKELSGLDKHSQLEQIEGLGVEAAEYLEKWATKAAESFKKVLILTHVPPFPEACLYLGKPSEEGLPFFCSKAAGNALERVARKFPGTQFKVFSGHTHDAAEVQIMDNLSAKVAAAEYGKPNFEVLDLAEVFWL